MCVAFWTLTHPTYALILAANRDEYVSRPTLPAEWHNFGKDSYDGFNVLSGRDVTAGGTWLGMNKQGDVAVLTNITELVGQFASSRGELASGFLHTPARDAPPGPPTSSNLSKYTTSILNKQRQYAGFNLLLASPKFRFDNTLEYESAIVTNSRGGGDIVARPLTDMESCWGGLSNADDCAHPDEDKDWPKVAEGKTLFKNILARDGLDDDQLIDELFDMMSAQNPTPPTTRYALRTAIAIPPIPVDPDIWPQSLTPASGAASKHAAPALQSQQTDYYCTRLTTVVLVRRDGQVRFVERDM